MRPAVLIPFGGTCPYRLAALDHITERHRQAGRTVVVGRCEGPWVKATAIADALDRTDADLLAISDADVWIDDLDDAFTAARSAPWVVPHLPVHRLTGRATGGVLAGGPFTLDLDQPAYRGWPGGGIVVLTRSTYDRIPLDSRFVGWGQEDNSWALALTGLAGPPKRLRGTLWHLWHPPSPRETRRIGSEANAALERRYIAAQCNPGLMAALVKEVTG